jgi:hypothetical protein
MPGCTAAWYHPKHGWPLKPMVPIEAGLAIEPE